READIDAHYARGGRRVVDAARAAWVAVAGVREGRRREMDVKEGVARQWQGDRREDVLVVVEVVAVQAPRAYDGLPGRDSAGVATIVARRGAAQGARIRRVGCPSRVIGTRRVVGLWDAALD